MKDNDYSRKKFKKNLRAHAGSHSDGIKNRFIHKKFGIFIIFVFIVLSYLVRPLFSITYHTVTITREAFGGSTNVGTVWVQGYGSRSMPCNVYLQPEETITVVAETGMYNGKDYEFDHWTKSGGARYQQIGEMLLYHLVI